MCPCGADLQYNCPECSGDSYCQYCGCLDCARTCYLCGHAEAHRPGFGCLAIVTGSDWFCACKEEW
jgi:hypothetical protein